MCPFSGGSWVPIEHKVTWPRPTTIPSDILILIHRAVWTQQTLAKNWRLCPFSRGGAGSPSNTMSPRLRPISVPSGMLIHTVPEENHDLAAQFLRKFRLFAQFFANFALAHNVCTNLRPCGAQFFAKFANFAICVKIFTFSR